MLQAKPYERVQLLLLDAASLAAADQFEPIAHQRRWPVDIGALL